RLCLACAVKPPELPQRAVIKGLNADRYTIYAPCTIISEPLLLDAVRIGFQRDLSIPRNWPQIRNRIQNRPNRPAAHQRGSAAAEEYCADLWPLILHACDMAQLPLD